ncbi:MAG: FtsB family cell division protein [Microgenomates group bacterium]
MKKRLVQTIFIIIGVALIIKLSGDILRLLKAGDQVRLAEKRVLELERKKEKLSEERQYYQSKEFIEEEARNKLNMAKPGETIVILPPNIGNLVSRPQPELNPQLPNWKKWWKLFF